jgi:hypothetical protein
MSSRAATLVLALLGASLTPTAARASHFPTPIVRITSVVVNEGDAGMTEFKAQVSYQIPAPIGAPDPVEVDIAAQPSTATAPDFAFKPVHLTLTANAGAQEITGYVIGDEVLEGDETFWLVARPTNGGGVVGSEGGLVTITDDDDATVPRLNIVPTTVVPEGSGQHTVDVQVTLQPAATHEVSVFFGTTSGDTSAFRGTMGSLKFAPCQTSATIPVDVIGNSYWNADKSFVLTLSQPKGAIIGNSSGTVVVANDDAATVLAVSDVIVVEGTGGTKEAELEIHMDPPAPPNSKIWLTVAGGAAKLGEDYEGQPFQVLSPQGGETVMKASFDIVGDAVHECSEGLVIQYQAVDMGDDTARAAKLLITDDDDATGPVVAGCIDPYTGPPPPIDTTGMAGAPGGAGVAGAPGGWGGVAGAPGGSAMAGAPGCSGTAGSPGGSGMAGAPGGSGMAGAPATTGRAGMGGPTTGMAGTPGSTGKTDPAEMNDRLGERGGCSIAPAGAPGSRFEALVWLGLALAAVKLRRAVRARLY